MKLRNQISEWAGYVTLRHILMHISICWNEILLSLNLLKFCSSWNKSQNWPFVRQLNMYILIKYTLSYGLLSLISLSDTDSREMARFMPASSLPSKENLV